MLIAGPDTRVVELRVHGILGTTAECLVDAVEAVDVAGDGAGRVVRPADRLRRPAPGAVLRADGRPLPRTLEGYVWGGLTSGGWAKAIWALLFPFSLANVSSWMLPPVPPGNRVAAGLRVCCRALLRLAAVLLTVLLVAQLAAVSLDLLATQCLGSSRCLTVVPGWVRAWPAVRQVIGVVPLLALVAVLAKVTHVDWSANDDSPRPVVPRQLRKMPGATRIADPDAPALRSLHLTAALSVIALLALGGPDGPLAGGLARVSWTAAVVLLLAAVIGAAVFGDPTGARPNHRMGRWLLTALSPVVRRLLITVAVLVDLSIPPAVPHPGPVLRGTDPTLVVVTVALGCTCIAIAVLLAPYALLARSAWAGLPMELRPWAGGWLAAPFMMLAALLGGGFGAGIGITVRQLLGGVDKLALPHGYAFVTLLWGVAAALAAVVAVLIGGFMGLRRLIRGVTVPPEVTILHAGRPADARAATTAWRLAGWERRHAHHVLLGITAILAAGALVSAAPWLGGVLPPAWTQPLAAVGLVALAFLAGALLRQVYAAARKPASARHLGGLSDLACFWPRESHPLVPPCYALKVVPELAARAAEHLAEPNTRVVLAGHSQGTMLVAAAATRLLAGLSEQDKERVGIVMAGSPVQTAYARAFPGVVPYSGLLELNHDLAGRWRTLCRGTDPIGGGATTWRRQVFDDQLIGVGFRVDGTAGALPPAVPGPTGALVLGGDHWLPDPQRGPFPGRRWASGVLHHQDYFSDPEWDRAVACATGMESPARTAPLPSVFRLPRPAGGSPYEEVKADPPPRQDQRDACGALAHQAGEQERQRRNR